MSQMIGTTSRRKGVSLGWCQGNTSPHWFLSSPWARKLPNDANLQKVTENPRERYGNGTTDSKFYIKNRKGGETPVPLHFVLFVLFSIVVVETYCLRGRGRKLFFLSQGFMCGGTMESDPSACLHLTCPLPFFLPLELSEDPSTSASLLIQITSEPSSTKF